MKHSSRLVLIVLVLLFLACEREARIDLGVFETQVVVLANFSDLDTMEVVISKSQSVIAQTPPEYISDARVRLYENGFLADQLSYVPSPIPQIPGYYISGKVVPEPGSHYRVVIDAPGFQTVEGTCTMPYPITLDTAFTTVDVVKEPADEEHVLVNIQAAIKIEDLSDAANYFHLNCYQEGFDFQIDQEGDTLKTSFLSFPLILTPDDPDIPVIPYLEDRGLLFADDALIKDRGVLRFSSTFQYRLKDQLVSDLLIELRSVSPEYYAYHRSLARQYQSGQDPFAEPVILYSNILGGQGIFAGFVPRFYRVKGGE